MIYQNFYIMAPITIVDTPIPLDEFKKVDFDGVELDPIEYCSINEYLAILNHTIERFSDDGYFIKGFALNIAGIDKLRAGLPSLGLTFNKDFFILSPGEVYDELKKEKWNQK